MYGASQDEQDEEIANQLSSINFDGIVNISGTGEATLTKYLSEIVQKFGDKKIHIELVTNGDKLKPKLIDVQVLLDESNEFQFRQQSKIKSNVWPLVELIFLSNTQIY